MPESNDEITPGIIIAVHTCGHVAMGAKDDEWRILPDPDLLLDDFGAHDAVEDAVWFHNELIDLLRSGHVIKRVPLGAAYAWCSCADEPPELFSEDNDA